jgi:hypothetical protein
MFFMPLRCAADELQARRCPAIGGLLPALVGGPNEVSGPDAKDAQYLTYDSPAHGLQYGSIVKVDSLPKGVFVHSETDVSTLLHSFTCNHFPAQACEISSNIPLHLPAIFSALKTFPPVFGL